MDIRICLLLAAEAGLALVLLWSAGVLRKPAHVLCAVLLLAAALAPPLSGVLTYGKPQALTFTDVCAMAAAGFAIPWAFSWLYGLRMLEGGYLLVLTPLVAAFCSDALALFTGMALGRHKLAPLVCPH